jgi:4-amino-4-deoxy-L-arabinose transferase-like glycosyltransferase
VLAAVVLGMITLLPFLQQLNIGLSDECPLCIGATRVLDGQTPYVDFDTRNTPGTYYVLALIYRCVGANILGTRLLVLLCGMGLCGAIYLTSRRLLPEGWAMVPVVLFATTGVTHFPLVNHHWCSLLAYALGVFALVRWSQRPELADELAVGVCAGTAWWFLQPEGGTLVLLSGIVGLTLHPRKLARLMGVSLAAAALTSLALWMPVLIKASLQRIFQESVVDVIRYHVGFNNSPYSWSPLRGAWHVIAVGLGSFHLDLAHVNWLTHALSSWLVWDVKHGTLYLLLFGTLLVLLDQRRRGRTLPGQECCWWALFLATMVNRGRQDMLYTNYLTPWMYLLMTWLVFQFAPRPRVWIALLLGLFIVQFGYSLEEAAAFRYPVASYRGTLYADSPQVAMEWNLLLQGAARLTPPGTYTAAFPYAAAFGFLSGTRTVMPDPLTMPIHSPQRDFDVLLAAVRRARPEYIYDFTLGPDALAGYPTVDPKLFFTILNDWTRQLLEGYAPVQDLPDARVYRRKT